MTIGNSNRNGKDEEQIRLVEKGKKEIRKERETNDWRRKGRPEFEEKNKCRSGTGIGMGRALNNRD